VRKLAVCFHHTNEDLNIWERFCKYLSQKIGEEFSLINYHSFYEEQERSIHEDYDLVFQNPETVFLFLKKGYIPVARLENQWDAVYYIAKKGVDRSNKFFKVGIVPIRVLYGTLLELEKIGIDVNTVDFKIYKNLLEIHQALLKDEIDIGITRMDTFHKQSEDFQSQFDILIEFKTGIFHSFMLKDPDSDFGEKILNTLFNMHLDSEGKWILESLGSNMVVPIGSEFEFLSRLNEIGDKFFEYRNYQCFFNAIDSVPNVGVMIYNEKIRFANKFAKKLLKYIDDELLNLDMVDIFEKDIKDKVLENINRRLSGEFFDADYKGITLTSKDGKSINVNGYASTIIFDGKPSGSFIFVDSRKNLFLEKLFFTMKEINQIIILSDDVEEVFEKLNKKVVSKLGFCYAKSIIFENEIPLKEIVYGNAIKYIEDIDITNKHITFDMVYNEDGSVRGCIFILPIYVDNRLISIVEIHTGRYLDYFNELTALIEELKNDLEYILKKIEKDEKALIFYNAVESSKDIFFILDENFKITYHNSVAIDTYRYSSQEIMGKSIDIFKSGRMERDFNDRFYKVIKEGKEFEGVFIDKTKNGDLIYVDTKVMPINKDGKIKGYVFIGKNITNEVTLKSEIEKVRYEDHLTGLLNYLGLQVKGTDFLLSYGKSISALVLIDIYNMSFINNSYGFDFGNEVLKFVGNSLKKLSKDRDLIARLGGDDFAVLFTGIKSKENIFKIMDRLHTFFSKNHILGGVSLNLSLMFSITIYPDNGNTITEMVNKASLALSHSKNLGLRIIYYDKQMSEKAAKFLQVEDLLSSAVKENRYVMHYQPYFYADNLKLAGFEALVRLKDKEGVILYPNHFVDHLEGSVHLEEFEEWLIYDTANLINTTGYSISINMSANNLTQEKLISKFKKISKGCFCDKLTIEITEREINENFDLFSKTFENFKKEHHIKLAIDDFGTGFSSLSRLKHLSCDILKIDIMFIREMFKSEKDTAFVNAIIDLGKRFNYTILAEGVETKEQYRYLRENGCDIVQGYLLGKPVDKETLLNTDWNEYSKKLQKELGLDLSNI